MRISIQAAITEGAEALRKTEIKDARRNAVSLLAHVLGRDPVFLLAHTDEQLTAEQQRSFESVIARRATAEPQQYITGHQEFYKVDFEVTPDVLIPRPETELIVETALELLKNEPLPVISDIGTGCGCIAISILKERSDAQVVATDISAAGLSVAARNARRHAVVDRLQLIESDLLNSLDARAQFSLIASNPPYIPERDWPSLPREVRDYEPRAALVSGADGLATIRRLLQDAPRFLRPRGFLIFEIGFGQNELVSHELQSNVWELLEIRLDLQGIPRTVVLRKR
jgi:release factor glutamine methyltransferase